MYEQKIQQLREWFKDYTKSFYGGDDYINDNIRVKVVHTFKVAQEMDELALQLGLDSRSRDLAVITGLLHDCGRFEQLAKYRTFQDAKSEDHAALGLRVIQDNSLLCGLTEQEQGSVAAAILNHNLRKVDFEKFPPARQVLVKMIRDADKIDIFRVIQQSYDQFLKNPTKGAVLVAEFGQETGECSEDVVEDVLNRRQVSHHQIKSLDDRKLLQLCWVYDLNFPQSLEKIIKRGYIKQLFEALPKTDQTEAAKQAIREYIAEILDCDEQICAECSFLLKLHK